MQNKFHKELEILKEQQHAKLSQNKNELQIIHEQLAICEHDQTTHCPRKTYKIELNRLWNLS